MKIKVTNKDFAWTVKYLKKNGYFFDSASKTWTGKMDKWLIDEGYVVQVFESAFVNEDLVSNIEA